MWRHARKLVWFGTLMGALFLGLALVGAAQAQAPAGPPAGTRCSSRRRIGPPWVRSSGTGCRRSLGFRNNRRRRSTPCSTPSARLPGRQVRRLRAARKQLRSLMEQQTPDPAAIQAAASKIKTLAGNHV